MPILHKKPIKAQTGLGLTDDKKKKKKSSKKQTGKQTTATEMVGGQKQNVTRVEGSKSYSTTSRGRVSNNLDVDRRLQAEKGKSGKSDFSKQSLSQLQRMKAEDDRKKKLNDGKKGPLSKKKNYGGVMPFKKK